MNFFQIFFLTLISITCCNATTYNLNGGQYYGVNLNANKTFYLTVDVQNIYVNQDNYTVQLYISCPR